MAKRIDRNNDERLYQPKIHSQRIREIYRLKDATGAPMTVLLDFAIQEFLASYGAPGPITEDQFLQRADQETWEEIREYKKLLDELDYQRCLEELEAIKNNL